MKAKYKLDISYKKRNYNKVTKEDAKHCLYEDEEGESLTKILWKLWAEKRGYKVESKLNESNFIIYDVMHSRTIKVLQKVKER